VTIKKKKSPRGMNPAAVPSPPPGPKIYYGPVRYKPKWCKFFKLVIYRTFYMFAMIM